MFNYIGDYINRIHITCLCNIVKSQEYFIINHFILRLTIKNILPPIIVSSIIKKRKTQSQF